MIRDDDVQSSALGYLVHVLILVSKYLEVSHSFPATLHYSLYSRFSYAYANTVSPPLPPAVLRLAVDGAGPHSEPARVRSDALRAQWSRIATV